jgi:hypothetical protein
MDDTIPVALFDLRRKNPHGSGKRSFATMLGFYDTFERFCADIFHFTHPSKLPPESVRLPGLAPRDEDRTPIRNEGSSRRLLLGG